MLDKLFIIILVASAASAVGYVIDSNEQDEENESVYVGNPVDPEE